ncbi:MAG: dihydrofolate reductase [Clostridia bacterium]|nr:dihydrofolate reductase [Clostridia bacterium]
MNYIVAVDKEWGIGKQNDLLFSLKGDMSFFRTTTSGKTVIMGDRTLASLPGGRPLKNRTNIVMTLDKAFVAPEGVTVCHSTDELFALLKQLPNTDDVFVIGGATIYNLLYPYCKCAYITKVNAIGNADVFIEDLDKKENWRVCHTGETMEENGISYTFFIYENLAVQPM